MWALDAAVYCIYIHLDIYIAVYYIYIYIAVYCIYTAVLHGSPVVNYRRSANTPKWGDPARKGSRGHPWTPSNRAARGRGSVARGRGSVARGCNRWRSVQGGVAKRLRPFTEHRMCAEVRAALSQACPVAARIVYRRAKPTYAYLLCTLESWTRWG